MPPTIPGKMSGCVTAFMHFFSNRSIINVWQCSKYVSLLMTDQQFVNWPYVMYCIRHIQNSGIFSNLFFQVHARIFKHDQSYLGIFTHIKTVLRQIQSYSAPFVTLAYSQLCVSPSIYKTKGLFKTLWNNDQAYSVPYNKALFTSIQAYSESLCNVYIHRNFAYSKSWNIQKPSITTSQCIFKTQKLTIIQNSDIVKARYIFRTVSTI